MWGGNNVGLYYSNFNSNLIKIKIKIELSADFKIWDRICKTCENISNHSARQSQLALNIILPETALVLANTP